MWTCSAGLSSPNRWKHQCPPKDSVNSWHPRDSAEAEKLSTGGQCKLRFPAGALDGASLRCCGFGVQQGAAAGAPFLAPVPPGSGPA